jgi:ABC-type sulfate transport system permease component
MLIAIFSLLIARAISVYGLLLFFAFFEKLKVAFLSLTVMLRGVLHAAVTLALALSLPTSLDYWWII